MFLSSQLFSRYRITLLICRLGRLVNHSPSTDTFADRFQPRRERDSRLRTLHFLVGNYDEHITHIYVFDATSV